jgi:NodT family efflux transporter outer membrane factor (OMF) lipoprotein
VTQKPEAWQWAPVKENPQPVAAEWWKAFRNAELNRLEAAAMENNQDLKAAVARIAQARAQAKVAGAPLYPTLSAGGGGVKSKGSDVVGPTGTTVTGGGISPSTTTYNAILSTSYELDFWGKNAAAADAANQRVVSTIYDRDTVLWTLQSDVATTYFQILAVRDRLRLARNTLANSESVLRFLESQFRAGTLSPLEVAQQRSAVAAQRATLPALVQTERETIGALAVLLGVLPQSLTIEGQTLHETRPPAIEPGLPSTLLERRPDIQKAESDLRASNKDIVSAHAARFPSITLTGQGGTQAVQLGMMFGPGSALYSIAASITAPIFLGGQLQGQEELTRAQFQELAQVYQKSVISAFRDVEVALSATDTSSVQYAESKEALLQAREAFRVAELRYRRGAADFLSVLNSQVQVTSSEDAEVQADLLRFNAVVSLFKALGGGWDKETALTNADEEKKTADAAE